MTKQLNIEEIEANYQILLDLIDKYFDDDRKEKLKVLLDVYEERIKLDPASSKEHYHNAYPGGYLEHTLNVYNIAMELFELWKKHSPIIDYTESEIAMVTLFHDLGKLGDPDNAFYMPQDNNWRKNNLGELYKINPNVSNMNGADRSLFTLQTFDIKLTQNEWIAIKIHEGMYDESNVYYLKVMSDSNVLKSNLPYLIHHADCMSSRIEYDNWKHLNTISKNDTSTNNSVQKDKFKQKKILSDSLNTNNTDVTKLFDDLFNIGK